MPPGGGQGGTRRIVLRPPIGRSSAASAGATCSKAGTTRVASISAGAPTPAGAARGAEADARAPPRERRWCLRPGPAGVAIGGLGDRHGRRYGPDDAAPLERLDPLCAAVSCSRSVLASRAWAKYSSTRIARPMSAANPASDPTFEMKWLGERAKGGARLASAGVYVAFRRPSSRSQALRVSRQQMESSGRARLREPGDPVGECCRVALEHEQVDVREGPLHPFGVQALALGAEDLLGGRRLRALVGVEEILVKFLPGARADDLDRDVALGLEAGEADHRLRQAR